MNELDKKAAVACGVVLHKGHYYWNATTLHHQPWTLNDARCREIVREHFGIETCIVSHRENNKQVFDLYVCYTFDGNRKHRGNGKTIAEAEIACIKAILENENE
jgi:hypothetical protein